MGNINDECDKCDKCDECDECDKCDECDECDKCGNARPKASPKDSFWRGSSGRMMNVEMGAVGADLLGRACWGGAVGADLCVRPGTLVSALVIPKSKIKNHNSVMLVAKQVTTNTELQQILDLQKENLRGVNSETEEKEQGFVTVTHNLEMLKQMHALEPSIIVKDGDALAGYAMVMLKESADIIPELFSMYADLKKLAYKGRPLSDYRFYVMGQVCVAAAYRGRGVFDMLYQKHREALQHKFDFIVTEVATRNTRSMRAHERVGFKTIDVYKDDLDEWAIIVWDWDENV